MQIGGTNERPNLRPMVAVQVYFGFSAKAIVNIKTYYFESNFLAGPYDIALAQQFLKHRTVHFKTCLLIVMPTLFIALIRPCKEYENKITSVTLHIEKNNMQIKAVKFPHKRINTSRHKTMFLTKILTGFALLHFLVFLLLLLSGDVETNPGPESTDTSFSELSSSSLSSTELRLLKKMFLLSTTTSRVCS